MATEGEIREFTPKHSTSLHLDLAKFAIHHYNSKEQNKSLKFIKLVHIKEHEIDGTTFYIKVEVTDDGEKKIYEAKVYIKSWANIKEVQDFKFIGDAIADADADASA